ncbi:MAG TPA: hypothetical protein VML75_21180 [Kofleriaceae bacterium]|nr:hypothetical protein [Kofleriaceae bacterium]
MKLECRDIINQPIDIVYPLMRDQLEVLVPYLPNVARIERIEAARNDAGKLAVVNHWYAKAEVPGPVKKILKPEMFSWKDHAEWDDEARAVSYRLESFLAKDLYDARGTNRLVAKGECTELHVSCDVIIHPDRVPGVPNFVLKKTLPVIESVIRQLLEPNLRSVGKGLTAYFADAQRAVS